MRFWSGFILLPPRFDILRLRCPPSNVRGSSQPTCHYTHFARKSDFIVADSSSSGTGSSEVGARLVVSNPEDFIGGILSSVRRRPLDFWHHSLVLENKPKNSVVVEFSSPNIAKPFHVGHLRSTLVGGFVANVRRAVGDSVTTLNFLGDWGTQFGVLTQGLDVGSDGGWKKLVSSSSDPLSFFHRVYVEANAAADKDPEFMKDALARFADLEKGEKNAIEDWRFVREVTLEELRKTYDRLGIRFDSYEGESQYPNKSVMEAVAELRSRDESVTEDDKGRIVASVADGRKVTLVKSDGSSIYLSRDIAAAVDRYQRFGFDEMLYVVDNSQMNHLRAVFELTGRLSPECGSRCRHVNFGRILGMSTRKGTAVMLSDILDEARDRMAAQQELSPNTRSRDPQTIETLGLSCLVINDLSHKRARDYEFDWNHALASKGDSGVALQYCHARLCSLENNCGVELPSGSAEPGVDVSSLLRSSEALALIGEISRFEDVLCECGDSLEPYHLVRYLAKLRTQVNKTLKVLPVKGQAQNEAQARLLLFHVSRVVMAAGLRILGVPPLEAM